MNFDDAPTAPVSPPLPRALLEDAVWSPLAYTGILHVLLDGGMTALAPPAQLLYLQFVREAIGRRRNVVRISLEELRTKTGMSRSTIHAALRRLASPDVDVVNVVHPGGAKVPGSYEVRLYSYQKRGQAMRRARRVRPPTGSIEHRLAELRDSDRADVETVYHGLPLHERQALEAEVREKYQDIGQHPSPLEFRQGVLFYLMKRKMYHRLVKTYPHWFR